MVILKDSWFPGKKSPNKQQQKPINPLPSNKPNRQPSSNQTNTQKNPTKTKQKHLNERMQTKKNWDEYKSKELVVLNLLRWHIPSVPLLRSTWKWLYIDNFHVWITVFYHLIRYRNNSLNTAHHLVHTEMLSLFFSLKIPYSSLNFHFKELLYQLSNNVIY